MPFLKRFNILKLQNYNFQSSVKHGVESTLSFKHAQRLDPGANIEGSIPIGIQSNFSYNL